MMGTIPQQFAMSTDIKIIIYHIHLPMTVEIVKNKYSMIIVSLLRQLLSGVEDEFLYNLRNLQNQRC